MPLLKGLKLDYITDKENALLTERKKNDRREERKGQCI